MRKLVVELEFLSGPTSRLSIKAHHHHHHERSHNSGAALVLAAEQSNLEIFLEHSLEPPHQSATAARPVVVVPLSLPVHFFFPQRANYYPLQTVSEPRAV